MLSLCITIDFKIAVEKRNNYCKVYFFVFSLRFSPPKLISVRPRWDSNPQSPAPEADALSIRPLGHHRIRVLTPSPYVMPSSRHRPRAQTSRVRVACDLEAAPSGSNARLRPSAPSSWPAARASTAPAQSALRPLLAFGCHSRPRAPAFEYRIAAERSPLPLSSS